MHARGAAVRTKLRGTGRAYARLMTMREVADLLGYRGTDPLRTLRSQLRALEQRTGKPFLVRTGPGARARYLVTLAALREACPHFFDRRETALESVRAYVEQIDARFAEIDQKIEALALEVGRLVADNRAARAGARR